MSERYKNLMSPMKLRNTVLKSRFLYPVAQPHFLQGPELYPADPVVSYYTSMAKNGSAMLMFHDLTNLNQRKMAGFDTKHFCMYDINDKGSQNYFTQFANFIHYYGSMVCTELCTDLQLPYCVSEPEPPGEKEGASGVTNFGILIGPEGVSEGCGGFPGNPLEGAAPFTSKTIDDYIKIIVEHTLLYKSFGFDAGMVDCGFNFFCGQFLTPAFNRRTDEYGGSFENRVRFPMKVLKALRNAIGDDFIIVINSPLVGNMGPFTGLPMEEAVEFLKMIEPYVDLLHVRSMGPGDEGKEESAPAAELSAEFKARGVKIPTAVNTPFMDLDKLEEIIKTGQADMISSGHMFICNEDLGDILHKGRGEDLNPCIECNICRGSSAVGDWMSHCTINPRLGMEHRADRMIKPVEKLKKVAVIGGGPAGMKCAMWLKERGHTPVIFEKSDSLGGQIKTSRYPDFKWKLKRYLDFLINQTESKGIQVRLNTEATPGMIKAEGFDTVIAATGASPKLPPVEGAGNSKWNIVNIYGNEDKIGKNVVVVGGSSGPAEAAIYLAELGHNVTVLCRKNIIAYDLNPIRSRGHFNHLAVAKGVKIIGNARTTKIEAKKVTYVDLGGNEHTIKCDDVLAAGGMKPSRDAAMSFYGVADEFYIIGDGRSAGNLRTAIRDAYAIAMQI